MSNYEVAYRGVLTGVRFAIFPQTLHFIDSAISLKLIFFFTFLNKLQAGH